MSVELAKRAVACKGWRHMDGMRYLADDKKWRPIFDTLEWRGRVFGQNTPSGWMPLDRDWLPDLDDPATLGCLLALVREAWDRPTSFVDHGLDGVWRVWTYSSHSVGRGATEAEALVAALEAAPAREVSPDGPDDVLFSMEGLDHPLGDALCQQMLDESSEVAP
jgi:hypothetical protein